MGSEEDKNKLDTSITGSDAIDGKEVDVLNCGHADVDSQPGNSECKEDIVNGSGIGPERDRQFNLVDDNAVEVQSDAVKGREVAVSCGHTYFDSQPSSFECKKDIENDSGFGSERDIRCNLVDENAIEVHSNAESEDMSISSDSGGQCTFNVNLATETASVSEKLNGFANGHHVVSEGISVISQKVDNKSISGLKRHQEAIEEPQPSVHINYNNLTRASKNKLEELLRQWSEWHAQHVLPSLDLSEILESGEKTFFPALVDLEKGSAVSFWLDDKLSQQREKKFTLDGNAVPLYDRGFALGLTSIDSSSNMEGHLEIIDDASRCFNCGSYNHSLRECPRPRDNVAVDNARKQHKARRNQNPGSRNSARYYQNSGGRIFDGLRPGALDSETRKLLGLADFDPPPWLSRMREIGYPPGYLGQDDEDQPSGITIYGDEEIAVEQKEGEIIKTDYRSKPPKKMMVEFPGINASIPENADGRAWEVASSSSHPYRNRPPHKWNSYSDEIAGDHYREKRWPRDSRDDGPPGDPGYYSSLVSSFYPQYKWNSYSDEIAGDHYREKRWPRDYRDDGPPGDPGYYGSSVSSFYPQYSSYDSSYASARRSPHWSRYQSDIRSPFRDEVPFTPDRFFSPMAYSSVGPYNWKF